MEPWRWRFALAVSMAALLFPHCVTCQANVTETGNSTSPLTTAPTINSISAPITNETLTAPSNATGQENVTAPGNVNPPQTNSSTTSSNSSVNEHNVTTAITPTTTTSNNSISVNVTTAVPNNVSSPNVTTASPPIVTVTSPRPVCSNDTCKHGVCGEKNGSGVGCICQPGWRGDNCSEDINECSLGICVNFDLCTNLVGSYTCYCKKGWAGTNCSEDIDECEKNHPCGDANSICKNTNGSYACLCNDGFERVNSTANCTKTVIIGNSLETNVVYGDEELFGPYLIPQSFPFNGKKHSAFYVSINGYVIFDDQLKRPFKPSNETVLEGQSIIAPYWTDIEIPEKSNTSKLFHLELSLENALKYNKTKAYFDQSAQIQSIMNESKIQTDLTSPTFIAVLTWSEVLPHKAEKFANLQPATFQLVLMTDGFQSVAIISYRTIWPANEHLKVDTYISGNHLEPIIDLKVPKRQVILLSNDSRPTNTYAACLQWRFKDHFQNYTKITCPCSLVRARQDRMFTVDEGQHRAQSKVWDSKGTKAICYYDDNSNMLITDPTELRGKPAMFKDQEAESDFQTGWTHCCNGRSEMCYRVFEVFSIASCSAYTALVWGFVHVSTLDGKEFIFNGWGEYLLLRAADRSLEIQGRTQKHQNFNVTLLIAVAIKVDQRPVVEIHHDATKQLSVYKDGIKLNTNITDETFNLQVDNNTVIIAVSPGIALEITTAADGLSLVLFTPPDQLQNSSGLLGYADGNPTNDFLLRNGTTFQEQLTPELIFQYGQSWMLQNASESLFNYTLDLNKGSFNDSQHRNFIPTSVPASDIDILSALNQTSQMENGLSHCNHSLACLQDFFITRNENFSERASIKDTIKAQIYLLGKSPPVFKDLPKVWNISLTAGIFRLNVTALTATQVSVQNYTLLPNGLNASLVPHQSSAEFTWYFSPAELQNMTEVPFFISAIDEYELKSTYEPNIVVCACQQELQCNFAISSFMLSSQQMTGLLYLVECQCGLNRGGRWCEKEVDACEICYPNATCNKTLTNSTICQACPYGYEGNGIQCYEVDECLGVNECEQFCQNTIGSFSCHCGPGFRLVGKGHCQDINECMENQTICSDPSKQFCTNTVGSYQCLCRPGYGGDNCSTKVPYVYGGQIVFAAIRDQEWSDDLNHAESKAFQTLAKKVSSQILAVLSKTKGFENIVEVNVIKFTKLTANGVQKRSTDSAVSPQTAATFNAYMTSSQNSSTLNTALKAGFDEACTNICSFGNEPGQLLGVNRDQTGFDETFDLCQSERLNDCHDPSTVCISYNGTWMCQCRTGYERWDLQTNACEDVNECSQNSTENLCGMNGTVCNNLPGTYNCTCSDLYHWSNTDTKCTLYDYCAGNPCFNDAECINTGESPGYACRCKYGWTGSTCDTDDEKAAEMKRTVIGLAAGLGAFCFLLIVIIIVMCVIRVKRKGSHYTSSYNGTYTIPRPYLGSGSDLEMVDLSENWEWFLFACSS
ncbi:mucin-like protein isoform X2 [Pomacea canaliculata]|uniref:mucin-like protein isoform X2 n=1 Tax=Pomacea canaliculata TaxID=400727 RepID=UPI000D726A2D|nr:mucin-like protein isoform X2 [Pomacea canaliculata]